MGLRSPMCRLPKYWDSRHLVDDWNTVENHKVGRSPKRCRNISSSMSLRLYSQPGSPSNADQRVSYCFIWRRSVMLIRKGIDLVPRETRHCFCIAESSGACDFLPSEDELATLPQCSHHSLPIRAIRGPIQSLHDGE